MDCPGFSPVDVVCGHGFHGCMIIKLIGVGKLERSLWHGIVHVFLK
jgi:hypothetical protein